MGTHEEGRPIQAFELIEGDVYRCVSSVCSWFTVGEEYRVVRTHTIGLEDNDGDTINGSSARTRFKYVPEPASALATPAEGVSDGGSTSYYRLPEHATELRHLISHRGMSKSRGDIFKACYRLGEKSGVDVMYDLRKMQFFVQDLIEMHERGEHL